MPLIDRSWFDSIELTDGAEAHRVGLHTVEISDTLSVSDTATPQKIGLHLVEIDDAVVATDSVEESLFPTMPVIPSLKVVFASDTISVSDSLDVTLFPKLPTDLADPISVTDYVERDLERDIATRIQHATGASTSPGASATMTLGAAPTDGNILVAVVSVDDPITNLGASSIVQTGVTWVLTSAGFTNPTYNFKGEIWIGLNVSSALSFISVNPPNGSSDVSAVVIEYSGIRTSGTITNVTGIDRDGPSTTMTIGPTGLTGASQLYILGGSLFTNSVTGISSTFGFNKVASVTGAATSRTEAWEFFADSDNIISDSVPLTSGSAWVSTLITLRTYQLEEYASDSIAVTDSTVAEKLRDSFLYDRDASDAISLTDSSFEEKFITVVTNTVATGLDVLMRGFGLSMRIVVADEDSIDTDLDVSVAGYEYRNVSLNGFITNAVSIVIEPDRPPVFDPLVIVDDLETPLSASLHPNAVYSPSTDFGSIGTEPDDVLEITSGVNVGNYVIRVVDGHFLFVEQALEGIDAGAVDAQVRKKQEKIPQFEAAVVIDQPMFNNGFSLVASMDVLVA